MNTKTPTLDEALTVVRDLPDDMQSAIASEMLERADGLVSSQLTDEHRVILKERMSKPRAHVPHEEMQAVKDKYRKSV